MASIAASTRRPSVLRGQVLWPGLLFLVVVGTTVAGIRTAAILTGWSAFRALADLFPPSLVEEGLIAERWYADHGRLTLFHVLPGAALLLIIPLQFIDGIRRRRPQVHRWVGRSLVALGMPVALSGLVLGKLSPFGGFTADSAIFLFGALFLVAMSAGFLMARRQQYRQHRQWMLRAVAVAAGIATVRVVALPLYFIVGGSALALIGPTFWLGLGLSAGIAEWWIWYSRRSGHELSVLPNSA
jgi:uncharacterized membrane protein